MVAAELELCWYRALERVRENEQRIAQHVDQAPRGAPPRLEDFVRLASDLEALWDDPSYDVALKNRIVRTLIQEVIADMDVEAGEIAPLIH